MVLGYNIEISSQLVLYDGVGVQLAKCSCDKLLFLRRKQIAVCKFTTVTPLSVEVVFGPGRSIGVMGSQPKRYNVRRSSAVS